MRQIIGVALLLTTFPMPLPAQASENKCDYDKNMSRAVLENARVYSSTVQSEQVPVLKDMVLSEAKYVILPKGYKLAEAVVLAEPFKVSLPAGTGVASWRDAEGEKLCVNRIEESFLGGPKVQWLCLKDSNGDGGYETFYGPTSKKKVKGPYPEISLAAAVTMMPSVPDTPENGYLATIAGERLIVSDVQDGSVTITHQSGPGMLSPDGRRIVYGVFAGDENKVVNVAASPIVEIAGHTVTFDNTDKNNFRVSVAGKFAVNTLMECDNTFAKSKAIQVTLQREFK